MSVFQIQVMLKFYSTSQLSGFIAIRKVEKGERKRKRNGEINGEKRKEKEGNGRRKKRRGMREGKGKVVS